MALYRISEAGSRKRTRLKVYSKYVPLDMTLQNDTALQGKALLHSRASRQPCMTKVEPTDMPNPPTLAFSSVRRSGAI